MPGTTMGDEGIFGVSETLGDIAHVEPTLRGIAVFKNDLSSQFSSHNFSSIDSNTASQINPDFVYMLKFCLPSCKLLHFLCWPHEN